MSPDETQQMRELLGRVGVPSGMTGQETSLTGVLAALAKYFGLAIPTAMPMVARAGGSTLSKALNPVIDSEAIKGLYLDNPRMLGPRGIVDEVNLGRAEGMGLIEDRDIGKLTPEIMRRLYEPPMNNILNLREQGGLSKTASRNTINNPALSAADHYTQAQDIIRRSGPIAGRAEVAVKVPGYAGAKALAQSNPKLGQLLERYVGRMTQDEPMGSLTQASPPSLAQLFWVLKPIFEKLPYPYLR